MKGHRCPFREKSVNEPAQSDKLNLAEDIRSFSPVPVPLFYSDPYHPLTGELTLNESQAESTASLRDDWSTFFESQPNRFDPQDDLMAHSANNGSEAVHSLSQSQGMNSIPTAVGIADRNSRIRWLTS